jgi:hypothetical protein
MSDVVREEITDIDAATLYKARQRNTANFSTYNLPELPENKMFETWDRLVEAERRLACPSMSVDGYTQGAADEADELFVIEGGSGILATAEHATDHQRAYKTKPGRSYKPADYGTAALGWVLQQDTDSSLIVAKGKQTGDANHDIGHPFKERMARIITRPTTHTHVSIHGASNGLASGFRDERNYHILLGIGSNPSERTIEVVDGLREVAEDLDLRLGVNQPTYHFDDMGKPKRKKTDGSYQDHSFSAGSEGTTRTFAQSTAEALTKQSFAAIQFELNSVLRLLPFDYELTPGRKSQRVGTYLGYLFMSRSFDLIHAPVSR